MKKKKEENQNQKRANQLKRGSLTICLIITCTCQLLTCCFIASNPDNKEPPFKTSKKSISCQRKILSLITISSNDKSSGPKLLIPFPSFHLHNDFPPSFAQKEHPASKMHVNATKTTSLASELARGTNTKDAIFLAFTQLHFR